MKAEERKQMILDCSKKLFSKHGYYNTQISDIVKSANIARGTIYQYFSNKDDIFISLLEAGYDEWKNTISAEIEGVDLLKLEPKEYLSLRIKNSLSYFAKDPEMSNLILRMGYGLPENLVKTINRLDEEIIAQITDEITYGKETNILRKDLNVELAANFLIGAILRIAYHYFVKNVTKNKKDDINKITDEIVSMMTTGIFAS